MINTGIQHISSSSTGAEVTANYLRLDHIHTDVDIVQDSLDSHIADFQVWKEFSLRTRIEINLSGHGSHPHSIAIFQLPEIFGGYLELVREIVEITITMMKDAGQDIHNANEKLIKGDEKFAAGEYKKAYKEYGKSYREATK